MGVGVAVGVAVTVGVSLAVGVGVGVTVCAATTAFNDGPSVPFPQQRTEPVVSRAQY